MLLVTGPVATARTYGIVTCSFRTSFTRAHMCRRSKTHITCHARRPAGHQYIRVLRLAVPSCNNVTHPRALTLSLTLTPFIPTVVFHTLSPPKSHSFCFRPLFVCWFLVAFASRLVSSITVYPSTVYVSSHHNNRSDLESRSHSSLSSGTPFE